MVAVDDNWLFPPFEAYRTKDFIIGRGATDNKGPAIAVLYLLKYLSSCGYSPKHRILQYLGCNEESGMEDIDYYLSQAPAPKVSIVPDLSFPICYAEKGILSFRYTIPFSSEAIISLKGGNAINIVPGECVVQFVDGKPVLIPENENIKLVCQTDTTKMIANGKSSHSAFPENSINAIGILFSALSCCSSIASTHRETLGLLAGLANDYTGKVLGIQKKSEELGDLTCVFSLVDWKQETLQCDFNIRYPYGMTESFLKDQLRQFAQKHGWNMEVLEASSASYFPKEHPAIGIFEEQTEKWTSCKALAYTTGGGTYARKLPCAFAAGLGIPSHSSKIQQFLAPGHGGAHQPDEVLEIEPFLQGIKILISSIIELDQKL